VSKSDIVKDEILLIGGLKILMAHWFAIMPSLSRKASVEILWKASTIKMGF